MSCDNLDQSRPADLLQSCIYFRDFRLDNVRDTPTLWLSHSDRLDGSQLNCRTHEIIKLPHAFMRVKTKNKKNCVIAPLKVDFLQLRHSRWADGCIVRTTDLLLSSTCPISHSADRSALWLLSEGPILPFSLPVLT